MPEKPIFIFTDESAKATPDHELSKIVFNNTHKVVGNTSQWRDASPENKARYDTLKQLARLNGRLAMETKHERDVANYGAKERPRLTAAELIARANVSREECNRLYRQDSQGSESNLQKLAESNPARYQLVRTAQQSYRDDDTLLVPKSNVQRSPIEPKLAARLNLPQGYMASGDEFLAMATLASELDTVGKGGA